MTAPEAMNLKTFDDWFILSEGYIEVRRHGYENRNIDVLDVAGLGVIYGATTGEPRHVVLELAEPEAPLEIVLRDLDHYAESFRDLVLEHQAAYGPGGRLAGQHRIAEKELAEARDELLDPYAGECREKGDNT